MINPPDKDIDDLCLEALGYYASLSVISILATYVLSLSTTSDFPFFINILLGLLLLALISFLVLIQEALSNKIWIPVRKLAELEQKNHNSLKSKIVNDVLVILYFAILLLPPLYTLSNFL